jgi:hypothetical protein
MQTTTGVVLLLVSVAMIIIARPKAGQDSAIWLSNPWILGQIYALAVLATAVLGVTFILSGWRA